jgi:hypothetical protein
MEESMCWEMDHSLFVEQGKAKKAKVAKKERAGVIENLLNEANKEAEKANVDATPVNEVMPAK